MASVAVITSAIPERLDLLAECLESVRSQTRQPDEHLICIDYGHRGTSHTLNRALAGVTSDFVAVLQDDDTAYPNHLEVLLGNCDGVDVVYPRCDADWPVVNLNADFNARLLKYCNYIPATALIRTDLLRAVGGWPDADWEDHELWKVLVDAGARFRKVNQVTWHYRRHGRPQKTFGTL